MAEGFLRHLPSDRFEAMSAGNEATDLDPDAVEAMREAGVDISAQRPKPLEAISASSSRS
jgi:arsenate reductase